MIIRHKIYKVPLGIGGSCATFNPSVDCVGTSNVLCSLSVNGVTILNTTDLYNMSTISTPISCNNGIVVTQIGIENSSYLTIYIDGIDIGESYNYIVNITHPDSATYYANCTNTFKLLGYDLGNGLTVTGNPDMDIYIVAKPAIPDAQNGFAKCTLYRKPGTSIVYIYNTHSSADQGTEIVTYTIDGTPVSKDAGTNNVTYSPTYTDSIIVVQIATAHGGACSDTHAFEGRNTTVIWTNTYKVDDIAFDDYTCVANSNCLNYTFTNYSYYPDSTNLTYSIAIASYANSTWTTLTTMAVTLLANGGSTIFEFTGDGIYRVTITYAITLGTTTQVFYLNVRCASINCVLDKFDSLLCCCGKDTCLDKDHYGYNWGVSVLGLLFVYNYYVDGYIDTYETVPTTEGDFIEVLNELTDDFCETCGEDCDDNINTPEICW